IGGHALPLTGGQAPDLSIGGIVEPLAAASTLWGSLADSHSFFLEALALGAAAAAIGACRRRGPWGGAAFGATLTALTLLADPGASALPLVAAAWVGAILLAAEPGPRRPVPPFVLR